MRSKLIVGLDYAAPIPLHTNLSSEKFEGFEVDVMNEIAKELNVALEHKVAYWKDIIADLVHNKIDVICSAATVTKERKKEVAFSKPYLNFHLALVCNRDNIISLRDLENKRVGVRVSTEAERYLKSKFPDKQLYFFDTNDEQYENLTSKQIDALIDDSPIAYGFANSNSAIVVTEVIESTPSEYAIIINKENVELRNNIDRVIEKLEKNGFLEERKRFWFKGCEIIKFRCQPRYYKSAIKLFFKKSANTKLLHFSKKTLHKLLISF